MLPTLIDETLIRAFKFHNDYKLYTGMWVKREFYKLVQTCDRQHRDRAFALGCQLEDQGYAAVITASSRGYKIWVEIGADVVAESTTLGFFMEPQSKGHASSSSLESQSMGNASASAIAYCA